MSLARTNLRHACLSQIKDRIEGIKSFSANRFRPLWQEEELPAIGVYTISETAEKFDEAPRRYKKRCRLLIEIILQADESLDDKLDYLCGAIENAIYLDETLSSTASDCQYLSTEIIEKVEGDRLTGSAVMEFEATYYEYAPASRELPPFEGGDFRFVQPNGTETTEGSFDVEV